MDKTNKLISIGNEFILEKVSFYLGNEGHDNLISLYVPPVTNEQQTEDNNSLSLEKLKVTKTQNLNTEIINQIAEKLGITFKAERSTPLNLSRGETLKSHIDTNGTSEVKLPGYYTANPSSYRCIREFQKELRKNPTDAEKVMWELLRNKKTDYKIRRQHIIDNFIPDFVCLRKNLVIEIDGKIHLQQKEYDDLRTARLNELGFEVIRFSNEEVLENAELVASKIKQKLDSIEDINTPLNLTKWETLGANSSPPMEGLGAVFTPSDILDYIYAVLHSPTYREKYKEFLKIDFPRVPYPKDKATFWKLVKLGGEIRQVHLLESPAVENYITQYPEDGRNVVVKPKYTSGKVYINDTQYFDNVPQIAWDFYIGGYQPAQKWLKDRKGRTLEYDEISHYQKIIVALTETDRLMKEIDRVEIE
jgi:very-short-patch-repair endonuclease